MSASIARLVGACCLLMAVAIVVPKMAPGFIASLIAQKDPAGATADSIAEAAPAGNRRVVAIPADAQGHFVADATVDGRAIRVMVDTGATTVALTADTARRLGFHLADADYTRSISTANGATLAAPVVLSEIRVGNIAIRDVAAVVVPGEGLDVNLLGMSFLNRLRRFEIGGGQLVLSE